MDKLLEYEKILSDEGVTNITAFEAAVKLMDKILGKVVNKTTISMKNETVIFPWKLYPNTQTIEKSDFSGNSSV